MYNFTSAQSIRNTARVIYFSFLTLTVEFFYFFVGTLGKNCIFKTFNKSVVELWVNVAFDPFDTYYA